jgi:hypothetical protein
MRLSLARSCCGNSLATSVWRNAKRTRYKRDREIQNLFEDPTVFNTARLVQGALSGSKHYPRVAAVAGKR